jgi:hypothetical protein
MIAKVLLRELLRAPKNIITGRWDLLAVQLRAGARTVVTLGDIVAARRQVQAQAITTSPAVIRRFSLTELPAAAVFRG